MNPLALRAAALVLAVSMASTAAATRTKANNTTALNALASWVEGAVPTSEDILLWDSTVGTANTSLLGGNLSVLGLQVTNPSGAVTIGNTAGALLTIGSGGIDMSAATQNLTISSGFAIGANQTWTVNGGRTLTGIAGSSTSSGSGTGNLILAQSGTGVATVIFSQNGNVSSGQTGWSSYSGNITVGANVKMQTQGNDAAALGTGLVTLNGGALHQASGNWTWSNAIAASAASVIGNDSGTAASGRTLKLLGNLASSNGSGLTFTNTNGQVQWGTNANEAAGFILAGAGASTYGTTTISANSRVRVGGNATATVAGDGFDAGARGSLGTGDVNLAATSAQLAFTRTDTHTVANKITGSGTLYIGGSATALAGTATQVVVLTGDNTFTGATRIASGTLSVSSLNKVASPDASSALGRPTTVADGTIGIGAAAVAATLRYTGGAYSTDRVVNLSGTTGGATLDLTGSTGLLKFTSALTATGAGIKTLTLAGDIGTQGEIAGAIVNNSSTNTTALAKTGGGTWTLSGANSYSGTTTVSGGTLRLGANDVLPGAVTVAAGATLDLNGFSDTVGTFTLAGTLLGTGTLTSSVGANVTPGFDITVDTGSTQTISAILAGSSNLRKNGAGTLVLTGANTLGSAFIVAAGWLQVADIADAGSSNLGVLGGTGTAPRISLVGGNLRYTGTGSQSTTRQLWIDQAAATIEVTEATATLTLTPSTASHVTGGTRSQAFTKTGAGTLAVNGVFSGSASITVSGGTLSLGSANTHSGATTVTDGTLRLANASAVGASSTLTLSGGSVAFDAAVAANAFTVGGLAGTSNLALQNTAAAAITLTVGNSGNSSYSGNLSGAGTLVKTGTGTLTLSGTNAHAATFVNQGTLSFGAASALGEGTVSLGSATAAGTLTYTGSGGDVANTIDLAAATNGGTLTQSGASGNVRFTAALSASGSGAKPLTLGGSTAGTAEFSGLIADGASAVVRVVKVGSGTWTLSNSGNSFTGGVAVNNGTLQADSISVLGAGTLSIGDAAAGTFVYTGGAAVTSKVVNLSGTTFGATLTHSGTGTLRFTSDFTATGVGSKTLTLSGSTAGVGEIAGAIVNNSSSNLTSLVKSGTGTWILSGANTYSGSTTLSAGTLRLGAAVSLGSTLTSASGDSTGMLDLGANTATVGVATNATSFYYGGITGTGTLRLNGGSTSIINESTGAAGANTNYLVWAPGTEDIGTAFHLDTGTSANRRDFGVATTSEAAVVTLASLQGFGAIRQDAGGSGAVFNRYLVVDQASDTTFNGALLSHWSGSVARTMNFTKRGNGSLTLAGFVGAQSTTGTARVHLTVEGGTLNITNSANTTTADPDQRMLGIVDIKSGVLAFSTQAILNTAGNYGATAINLNGGTLLWNTDTTQDISAGGRLTLLAGKDAKLDTNGNNVTLASAFAGGSSVAASLTKLGAGTLTLSAANTYTGGTTVSAGTLILGNASALGGGAVAVASGAALDLAGFALASNNLTLAGTGLSSAGALLNSGAAATLGGTLTLGAAATIGAGNITLNGSLAGEFALTKDGSGTLTLNGASNAATSIAVNAGTLAIGGANALGSATVTVASGATLNLANFAAANSITLASGGILLNQGSFAGTLGFSGNASLNGTFGGTFVTSSTLTSSTGLNFTGTLKGTGTIVGDVVLEAGAVHAPGNSPGLQVINGNLTYSDATTVQWELAANSESGRGVNFDGIDVSGILTLGPLPGDIVSLSLAFGGTVDWSDAFWASNRSWLLYDVGVTAENFSNLQITGSTFADASGDLLADVRSSASFGLQQVGNEIRITYTAVPEPSTYGLLLGALALAGAARRRRRSRA